jgi:hypothetical protein
MAYPRLAATIRSTLAALRADQGPALERYAISLDRPRLFRWAVGSLLAHDAWTTIVPVGGGTAGAWLEVREDDKGADVLQTDTVLAVGGKRWRRIAAGALSANLSLTLSTANAAAGDLLEVTRLDVGAYTAALVNGGPAAGTLVTLPVSARSRAVFFFDGTNWLLRASHLML